MVDKPDWLCNDYFKFIQVGSAIEVNRKLYEADRPTDRPPLLSANNYLLKLNAAMAGDDSTFTKDIESNAHITYILIPTTLESPCVNYGVLFRIHKACVILNCFKCARKLPHNNRDSRVRNFLWIKSPELTSLYYTSRQYSSLCRRLRVW
jgi:hypothetical protein